MALPILSLTCHCRLRISPICLAQAGSHTASHILAISVVLCTSCTTLPLGKLQQGYIHSPTYINPLCSEHSNNNSHPPSLASLLAFSDLETLQR